jgi:hypothetical protein
MNRTGPVRARREWPDVCEFVSAVLPMSRTSEVREQGFSLPLVPNFGTPVEPQSQSAELTESGTTGLWMYRTSEGPKS